MNWLSRRKAVVPSVDIYTKMFCSYCTRAKQLLDSKGVEYREHAVDFGGAERQEMIERARGRTTVPQIFIGGRHVGGCDELMMLEREGKLNAMLAADQP
jgi:glutaredoxin 3